MKATIIAVPYAAGRFATGMGLGPVKYLATHPEVALAAGGHDVEVVEVRPRLDPAFDEPAAVAVIDTALADAAAAALAAGRFPLVLAGNCNSALGTLAGMQATGATRVGIVWFDAHGDLNTPDTTPGGFFDGMGLAIATGRTGADIAAAIGVRPVLEAHVLHLGARDLDPPEIAYLARGVMPSIGAAALQADVAGAPDGALRAALAALRAATDQVYLHVDIDVLAAGFAPGVDFPSAGGLSLPDLENALRRVVAELPVRAAALTAYDPDRDRGEVTLRSGLRLVTVIADALQAKAGR